MKNQRIKERFVGIHIYSNVSTMVEELLKAHNLDSSLGFDLYGSMKPYGSYGSEQFTEEKAQSEIEDLESEIEDLEMQLEDLDPEDEDYTSVEKELEEKQERKEDLESLDFYEYPEIYEYWLVSSYLAEKLEYFGHTVIRDYDVPIWGRPTTGQAILLDSVISYICENMGILEGQENEWN